MVKNGKRVREVKREVSVDIYPKTYSYYTESSNKKIPLNWTREYINNQLCLSFDNNNFYRVIIPTGMYCVLTEEDKKNCNIINDDSIKLEKNKGKFIWKKDKIPLQLLYDFIRVSAQVYNKYKSEFAGAIFYDCKQEDYVLLFPEQLISGASVSYNVSEGFNSYPNKDDLIYLIDMHSHHTMSIGFSPIDDHSDSDLGTFGNISLVIKSIDKVNFTNIKDNVDIRFTIQDITFDIDLFEVFDNNDSDYEFALSKIKMDSIWGSKKTSYYYNHDYGDNYSFHKTDSQISDTISDETIKENSTLTDDKTFITEFSFETDGELNLKEVK